METAVIGHGSTYNGQIANVPLHPALTFSRSHAARTHPELPLAQAAALQQAGGAGLPPV
jgi:hypothetical protein